MYTTRPFPRAPLLSDCPRWPPFLPQFEKRSARAKAKAEFGLERRPAICLSFQHQQKMSSKQDEQKQPLLASGASTPVSRAVSLSLVLPRRRGRWGSQGWPPLRVCDGGAPQLATTLLAILQRHCTPARHTTWLGVCFRANRVPPAPAAPSLVARPGWLGRLPSRRRSRCTAARHAAPQQTPAAHSHLRSCYHDNLSHLSLPPSFPLLPLAFAGPWRAPRR